MQAALSVLILFAVAHASPAPNALPPASIINANAPALVNAVAPPLAVPLSPVQQAAPADALAVFAPYIAASRRRRRRVAEAASEADMSATGAENVREAVETEAGEEGEKDLDEEEARQAMLVRPNGRGLNRKKAPPFARGHTFLPSVNVKHKQGEVRKGASEEKGAKTKALDTVAGEGAQTEGRVEQTVDEDKRGRESRVHDIVAKETLLERHEPATEVDSDPPVEWTAVEVVGTAAKPPLQEKHEPAGEIVSAAAVKENASGAKRKEEPAAHRQFQGYKGEWHIGSSGLQGFDLDRAEGIFGNSVVLPLVAVLAVGWLVVVLARHHGVCRAASQSRVRLMRKRLSSSKDIRV